MPIMLKACVNEADERCPRFTRSRRALLIVFVAVIEDVNRPQLPRAKLVVELIVTREIIRALLPLNLVPQHVHADPFETGCRNSLDAVVTRLDDMDVHAKPARHREI